MLFINAIWTYTYSPSYLSSSGFPVPDRHTCYNWYHYSHAFLLPSMSPPIMWNASNTIATSLDSSLIIWFSNMQCKRRRWIPVREHVKRMHAKPFCKPIGQIHKILSNYRTQDDITQSLPYSSDESSPIHFSFPPRFFHQSVFNNGKSVPNPHKLPSPLRITAPALAVLK